MIPENQPVAHRILLVDADHAVREMKTLTLERKGFEVVDAANVTEALKLISTETFDALITDLHMPNPGDGFTVVSAMHHSQPDALTLITSGYPDVQAAMAAILLEADEILAKPFDTGELAELLQRKMRVRKPATRLKKQRVAEILDHCMTTIVRDWLVRVKQSAELNHLPLTDIERTGHLPRLLRDLVVRLKKDTATTKDGDAACSEAAAVHGELRHMQSYTPAMLVHESRILQVTLFGTLQSNMSVLDFSLLLPDVMTIADEVDAQLTQSMDSYMNAMQRAIAS